MVVVVEWTFGACSSGFAEVALGLREGGGVLAREAPALPRLRIPGPQRQGGHHWNHMHLQGQ